MDTGLQTYHATTQTETVRDDAMLVVSQMGQVQPALINLINDQVFVGGGIIYADGVITVHAKHDELVISQIVGKKKARQMVARFGFNTSWSMPGCWRDHLHTLAIMIKVQKVFA